MTSPDSPMIISLDSPTKESNTSTRKYLTATEWVNREAYTFVVARCGKWEPWNPAGWPDEVADKGCRCNNHSFVELRDENGDYTDVWACSDCLKPKPLMFYVEWCESCGTPYVVSKYPDRTLLCKNCGG